MLLYKFFLICACCECAMVHACLYVHVGACMVVCALVLMLDCTFMHVDACMLFLTCWCMCLCFVSCYVHVDVWV